jgi:hypothetical protein
MIAWLRRVFRRISAPFSRPTPEQAQSEQSTFFMMEMLLQQRR